MEHRSTTIMLMFIIWAMVIISWFWLFYDYL
jgi:hypothetical protein